MAAARPAACARRAGAPWARGRRSATRAPRPTAPAPAAGSPRAPGLAPRRSHHPGTPASCGRRDVTARHHTCGRAAHRAAQDGGDGGGVSALGGGSRGRLPPGPRPVSAPGSHVSSGGRWRRRRGGAVGAQRQVPKRSNAVPKRNAAPTSARRQRAMLSDGTQLCAAARACERDGEAELGARAPGKKGGRAPAAAGGESPSTPSPNSSLLRHETSPRHRSRRADRWPAAKNCLRLLPWGRCQGPPAAPRTGL